MNICEVESTLVDRFIQSQNKGSIIISAEELGQLLNINPKSALRIIQKGVLNSQAYFLDDFEKRVPAFHERYSLSLETFFGEGSYHRQRLENLTSLWGAEMKKVYDGRTYQDVGEEDISGEDVWGFQEINEETARILAKLVEKEEQKRKSVTERVKRKLPAKNSTSQKKSLSSKAGSIIKWGNMDPRKVLKKSDGTYIPFIPAKMREINQCPRFYGGRVIFNNNGERSSLIADYVRRVEKSGRIPTYDLEEEGEFLIVSGFIPESRKRVINGRVVKNDREVLRVFRGKYWKALKDAVGIPEFYGGDFSDINTSDPYAGFVVKESDLEETLKRICRD